jgi:hypothetical protein
MELLAATRTAAETLEVTLGDDAGLISLSGTPLEIAALCDAMEQAAVLAGASPRTAWLSALPAGDAVVRLGIRGGRVRLVVGPAD